jgi:hypothetical protein
VVIVRVPKELKEKMSRVQEDWANYLRSMIEPRVKEQEMFEASRRVDEIRSKTTRDTHHAAESVSEDRDQT